MAEQKTAACGFTRKFAWTGSRREKARVAVCVLLLVGVAGLSGCAVTNSSSSISRRVASTSGDAVLHSGLGRRALVAVEETSVTAATPDETSALPRRGRRPRRTLAQFGARSGTGYSSTDVSKANSPASKQQDCSQQLTPPPPFCRHDHNAGGLGWTQSPILNLIIFGWLVFFGLVLGFCCIL